MAKLFFIEPIGAPGTVLCKSVGSFLEETFGLPFAIGEPRDPPVSAYNPLRGQYMAFKLLEFLKQGQVVPGTFRHLGIFDLDLCTPVLQYVFGLARMGGRECLVSTHRLKPELQGRGPDPALFERRVLKEVLHELGHTFGIKHCREEDCIMSVAHGVAQVDRRRAGYCPACLHEAEVAVASDSGA